MTEIVNIIKSKPSKSLIHPLKTTKTKTKSTFINYYPPDINLLLLSNLDNNLINLNLNDINLLKKIKKQDMMKMRGKNIRGILLVIC